MTFLTILGSFRLVLEAKTGKEIPEPSRLEFLEKFLADNFVLSDAKDNTSGPLNRGGIADLTFLRTLLAICQKSGEPSFWEVMDSFVLLLYASLAASRILLQPTIACLNFTLVSKDLFCWYKQKKVISMYYGSNTSTWKPWRWVRLDLILTMRDIYINSNLNPLTKFARNRRSIEFKDILQWIISQMIMKTYPVSTRIVISYEMKQGIQLWIWWKVNGNWDNNIIAEQMLASEEKNKSKRAGLSVTVHGMWLGKLTIWERSFDQK